MPIASDSNHEAGTTIAQRWSFSPSSPHPGRRRSLPVTPHQIEVIHEAALLPGFPACINSPCIPTIGSDNYRSYFAIESKRQRPRENRRNDEAHDERDCRRGEEPLPLLILFRRAEPIIPAISRVVSTLSRRAWSSWFAASRMHGASARAQWLLDNRPARSEAPDGARFDQAARESIRDLGRLPQASSCNQAALLTGSHRRAPPPCDGVPRPPE